MSRFFARLGDQSFEVDVLDGTVQIAGAPGPVVCERAGEDEIDVTSDGVHRRALVVADGERSWVFVAGEVFEIEVMTAMASRRRPGRHHHESLSAPMPAKVIQVGVQAGSVVKKGDTVIVLEAMKMELPLRAPHDGVIESVRCRPGDVVQPGVPLIDLDEPHDT
jgi:biotin carboxyl carrier protein